MRIFSNSARGIVAWGPMASVSVSVGVLGGLVDDDWVLTNFRINAKEITDIRQCFDDTSYIYALGNDQVQCTMSLTFAIFLGKKNCNLGNNTKAINSGLSKYESNRISKKTTATTISIGGFSRTGWLVGIEIGNANPKDGVCYGTLHFIIELNNS